MIDALRYVGNKARAVAIDRRDAELAGALQDPQRMLALLKTRLASGEPLTDYEARVIQALQAGAKIPEARDALAQISMVVKEAMFANPDCPQERLAEIC